MNCEKIEESQYENKLYFWFEIDLNYVQIQIKTALLFYKLL
jgi:hypothetical protein